MRNQPALKIVENIVDLQQSTLSTHNQCSVKILNIAQMAIALLLLNVDVSLFLRHPVLCHKHFIICLHVIYVTSLDVKAVVLSDIIIAIHIKLNLL